VESLGEYPEMEGWRGRILMLIVTAFYLLKKKLYDRALAFML
jgi:hypothetical protein